MSGAEHGRIPSTYPDVGDASVAETAAEDGSFSSVGRAGADPVTAEGTAPGSEPKEPRKSYCTTVCHVPPPSASCAWEALTKARRELCDPGFYRWPPHANLLYPFVELQNMGKRSGGDEEPGEELFEEEILWRLVNAAERCEPFEVVIDRMGTFGGKNRGVLWAYPRSRRLSDVSDEGTRHAPPTSHADEEGEGPGEGKDNGESASVAAAFCDPAEPLIQLQALLEEQFPACTEQRKSRRFHPHITLSHFENLTSAGDAQGRVESWWQPVSYSVKEIYVLRRVGDDGQFEICATVPLGTNTSSATATSSDGEQRIRVHDPPAIFPGMPDTEDAWVNEARMALKARRNNNDRWRGRGRKKGGRRRRNARGGSSGNADDRGPIRSKDTPEVIEAKRAARRAKREAMEKSTTDIARALEEE